MDRFVTMVKEWQRGEGFIDLGYPSFSGLLKAADDCVNIFDLIKEYRDLIKYQIHYTIAEMEFAREHFISLAEDMPVREGTNETGFKRKFLNDV